MEDLLLTLAVELFAYQTSNNYYLGLSFTFEVIKDIFWRYLPQHIHIKTALKFAKHPWLTKRKNLL